MLVDTGSPYDLRAARDAEQAALKLTPSEQHQFGEAFVKSHKVCSTWIQFSAYVLSGVRN